MAMTGADRAKRFRIKHKAALRDKARDRMRAKRAAEKANKAAAVEPLPKTPGDTTAAICEWAAGVFESSSRPSPRRRAAGDS